MPPESDLLVADARVLQLDHIGLLGPRLACAHAMHVSASDIDRDRLRAYRRELAA